MDEFRVYLDTNKLIERYVNEVGSETSDSYFHMAQRGNTVICLSEINLGQAAVVFTNIQK
jgi:ribosomal protein L10